MNLKVLRLKENLKQADVAKVINKSPVAYGFYETGKREPDIETLCKLADFYNVSLDFLCGRQYNNNIGYVPDDKKALINEIIDLDENSTNEIHQYIKGYKSAKNSQKNTSKAN